MKAKWKNTFSISVSASYRSGTCRQGSIGEVRAAEVPEVREHEERVPDVGRGLEDASITLLLPQSWEIDKKDQQCTLTWDQFKFRLTFSSAFTAQDLNQIINQLHLQWNPHSD